MSGTLAIGPRDLAKMIGVSSFAVYAAIKKGEVKATKLGRRWLIPKTELDRLLDTSKVDIGS